jgi:hypothetical protein
MKNRYMTGLLVAVALLCTGGLYNATTTRIEETRTPTKFVSLNLTLGAGDTAAWTPAAGKKFRLLGYAFHSSVSGSAITLKDGSTTMWLVTCGSVEPTYSPPNMGNGYLSTTANNALNLAHANGTVVRGVLFGTEE